MIGKKGRTSPFSHWMVWIVTDWAWLLRLDWKFFWHTELKGTDACIFSSFSLFLIKSVKVQVVFHLCKYLIYFKFNNKEIHRWLSKGLCQARKCQLEDIVWEKVWFAFTQWTFTPETFSGRQKGKRKPVLSLLPSFLESIASRNPSVLCQKHGGACTTYYIGVPMCWVRCRYCLAGITKLGERVAKNTKLE